LAKAVARFPAGTGRRWDAVAGWMNESIKPKEPFTSDECREKAHAAVAKISEKKSKDDGKVSLSLEGSDWTAEEQKALERGLATYPASAGLSTADRWVRIASEVDGRSAKECIAQFKLIRDRIKSAQGK